MRFSALAGLLLATAAATGCVPPEPVRASSNWTIVQDGLDAPPVSSDGEVIRVTQDGATSKPSRRKRGVAANAREVTASDAGKAHGHLPAPHRLPTTTPTPTIASPDQLRSLVGLRDARDSTVAAIDWLEQLGIAIDGDTISDVIEWGERRNRLADRTAIPMPGDLLVFERTDSDAGLDLVAVVIARDARGVIEMLYVGGGVIRRGFVDPARPTTKRDDKAMVVNSFIRHGRRWPPAGTRYLSGELLAHVIHTH